MGIKKKHVPGCSCCNCTRYTDTLRDTTLSPFTSEAGSWTATSNGYETDSDFAQVIYPATTAALNDHFYMEATVDYTAGGTGTTRVHVYRLIFDWVDASNYWYAQFENAIDSTGTVALTNATRIGKVVAGANSTLASYVRTGSFFLLKQHTIAVCKQGDTLKAYVNPAGPDDLVTYIDSSVESLSSRFGLGTGNIQIGASMFLWFYNWELAIFQPDSASFSTRSACERCPCDNCNDSGFSNNLELTISSITGSGCCADINGVYELEYKSGCLWEFGPVSLCESDANAEISIEAHFFSISDVQAKMQIVVTVTNWGASDTTYTLTFEQTFVRPEDCGSFDDDIPFLSASAAECTTSSALAHIVAI